jgi:hypothetical protein
MNIQGRFFLAVMRFGSFLQKCDKFVQVFYNLQPGSSKGVIRLGSFYKNIKNVVESSLQ